MSLFKRLRQVFSPERTRSVKLSDVRASWLVVGLGNPGPQYELTRHNIGFLAVDVVTQDFLPVEGIDAHAAIYNDALILKPTTFMNLSGKAVAPCAKALNIPPERVVVLHDELDLPNGSLKLKRGGNENGHNGLKSITQELGTRDYLRLRIGISRPPRDISVPDYVLGPLDEGYEDSATRAAQAIDVILDDGFVSAQNVVNSGRWPAANS